MNLKETYNRIARDWHQDHQMDDWWVEGTNTFISYLQPGAEVLDVGCGAGTKSKYLSAHGLQVTGIDFSEGLIEIAREEVPMATFEVRDMREVGSLSQVFDAIFAQASLLHIPRDEMPAVLSALQSKLKDGGLFYAAVKGARPDEPLEEVKVESDYGYPYERFFSYFTMEELETYFKNIGLEVLYTSSTQVGKTSWLQIIGRK